MAERVAGLTFDAQTGWAGLRGKLRRQPQPQPRQRSVEKVQAWLAWPGKFGWFVAGQALAAALILMLAIPRPSPPAAYHTLSAAPTDPPGNAIVLFRPDTSEAEMRAALVASRARIVDGPTASGAYVLRVADEQRDAIVSELQSLNSIVLAQPIDPNPK